MPKSDDKGEPVKTVTIGGKKVEVPIIFILPEEAGEKEIERYQHPKVHIESKKVAPLLAGGAVAGGVGAAGAARGTAGAASAGSKAKPMDNPVSTAADVVGGATGGDTKSPKPESSPVESTVGAVADAAKLSETLSSDSEEKPLEELTHGKLEEVEKLPFPVPKEKVGTQRDSKGKIIRVGDMLQSDIDERDALYRHATGSGFPQERGVKDSIVAYPEEMPKQKEISHETAEANKAKKKKKKKLLELNEDFFDDTISRVGAVKGYSDDFKEGGFKQQEAPEEKEENTPYFDLLSPEKKKKKKKKRGNSYEELLSAEKDCGCGHSHKKRKKKDCKDGKCSKKPSKPDYDPSKVADEKYFKTEAEARAVKGATSVLRHRSGLFTPVFGDKKELDRVYSQLKDHNDKNPSPLDEFDPEQSISDLSGESQEKAKGHSGDDDPRRHGRRPDKDEDVGQHEGRHRGHKPDRHEEHGTHGMGLSGFGTGGSKDFKQRIEDKLEHTDEEKEDFRLANEGKVSLPKVARTTRTGKKRPSLYGESVGMRSAMAGLPPEETAQNMHMATVSEENAELWKSWLQKRDDWDKEERENDDKHFGRKRVDSGTKRGKKEGLYEELDNPKLVGNLEDEALETRENAGRVGQTWGSTSFDVETDKKTGKPVDVTPSRVVGTGRDSTRRGESSPHSALAHDARYSDGSEAMNITQENANLWKSWLENKSLGALGWGKLDRKTGKKKKLRRRQPTLDDFPEDNGDKKDET